MSSFFRRLSWLVRRRQQEAELREELEFHLQEEAADRRGDGLNEEEAGYAARRDLGNYTLVQEDTRAAWGWTQLEQSIQDMRCAFRSLCKNPLFTVVAVLTLALGIGANTAIFSLMDQVLLQLLPVKHPEQLVLVAERGIRFGSSWGDNDVGGQAAWILCVLFVTSKRLENSISFGRISAGAFGVRHYELAIEGESTTRFANH